MAKAIRGWLQFAASKKPPYPSLANRTHVNLRQTNNSSIVSKRSVERLYFPTEAHFLRYFVKKPQRRSPLINRGYWLRMNSQSDLLTVIGPPPDPDKIYALESGLNFQVNS